MYTITAVKVAHEGIDMIQNESSLYTENQKSEFRKRKEVFEPSEQFSSSELWSPYGSSASDRTVLLKT